MHRAILLVAVAVASTLPALASAANTTAAPITAAPNTTAAPPTPAPTYDCEPRFDPAFANCTTCAAGLYETPLCQPAAMLEVNMTTAAEGGVFSDETFYSDADATERLGLVVATELYIYLRTLGCFSAESFSTVSVLNVTRPPEGSNDAAGPVVLLVMSFLRPTLTEALAAAECSGDALAWAKRLPQFNVYGRAASEEWITATAVATRLTDSSPCGPATLCPASALVVEAFTPKPAFVSSAFLNPSIAIGVVIVFALVACVVVTCAARRMRMVVEASAAAGHMTLPDDAVLFLDDGAIDGRRPSQRTESGFEML